MEWWICGEWCTGPFPTRKAALEAMKPFTSHAVFSNQFWWPSRRKKGWKGW